jgi:hypothetical protein
MIQGVEIVIETVKVALSFLIKLNLFLLVLPLPNFYFKLSELNVIRKKKLN